MKAENKFGRYVSWVEQQLLGLNHNQANQVRLAILRRLGYIPKICRECGDEYKAKNGKVGFCSQPCATAFLRKLVLEKTKSTPYKQRRNRFLRDKIKRNHEFRIKLIVHKSVWRWLSRGFNPKSSKVAAALPYSIPQLKAHLESQFNNANGFTWKNYGHKWELDHIIPQSAFHFTSMDSKAFRDCWALSNLRPLKCCDNLKKASHHIASCNSSTVSSS